MVISHNLTVLSSPAETTFVKPCHFTLETCNLECVSSGFQCCKIARDDKSNSWIVPVLSLASKSFPSERNSAHWTVSLKRERVFMSWRELGLYIWTRAEEEMARLWGEEGEKCVCRTEPDSLMMIGA